MKIRQPQVTAAADELDRALLSRFMNIKVIPDVVAWAAWAVSAGIHSKIIDFVNASPGVFDDPDANPRSWHYASQFLSQWEENDRDKEILTAALAGLVGEKWALAFLRVYADQRRPLEPAEIIEHYHMHRAALRDWVGQRHLDVVAASVELLKRHLQPQRVYDAVVADAVQKNNVQEFFADLPADLRGQVGDWLEDRGFRELSVKAQTKRKKP